MGNLAGFKSKDDKYNFWADPGRWPADPSGYIFLARAFHEIGRARFGNDWTGHEPYAASIPDPVLLALLKKPNSARTAEENERLIRLRASYAATRQRNLKESEARARVIEKDIIKRCESGELLAAVRPTRGGAMTSVPAHYWNGADPAPRFYGCQMSMTDPFGRAVAGDGYSYIFVQHASLEKLLLSQPFSAKPQGLDFHLSPYMQTLVTVARKLLITPKDQPKKEAIIAEIRATWTGRPEALGKTLVEYMATILREPESQLGRARKPK
jgi:hypothetical protein